MTLSVQVDQTFAPGGALAAHCKGFSVRTSQLEMAQAVAGAIDTKGTLVAEAGTGTGKTFAYLVPALLSGGKVLVSTASKALQDQLFEKDIPLVRAALKRPVEIALLKGRGNYLCHHFLQRTKEEARLSSRQEISQLRQIEFFSRVTTTGDKADCSDVPENAPIWGLVTSTRESCLGQNCSFHEDCFVVKARREAQAAEVVVVNHHLFLADLALRETGNAELLPRADVVIFDEAHQLRDIATQFFGQSFSSHQWFDLLRDVLVEGRASARDAADWDAVIHPFETQLKQLRAGLAGIKDVQRIPLAKLGDYQDIQSALAGIRTHAENLQTAVTQIADRSEAWQKLDERISEALATWQVCLGESAGSNEPVAGDKPVATDPQDPFTADMADAHDASGAQHNVQWVTLTPHMVQLHNSPMDIAEPFAQFRNSQEAAWIFTSATLSVKGSFEHFTASLGLSDPETGLWHSPFDYENQALLCVPQNAPEPQAPDFPEKLAELCWPALQASDGGVFFLCTTLRAVSRIGKWLEQRKTAEGLDWTLLIQGQASKAEMLERFRSSEKPVLVGSATFWEGVDMKGDGLRLVIIDKIPFAPPDDPLVAARNAWFKDRGMDPFRELSIPEAAIALKQGAGRLIRDETDRGVLVIGDHRLLTKNYGSTLWRSLPPFKRTRHIEDTVERLRDITRSSTTAQIST